MAQIGSTPQAQLRNRMPTYEPHPFVVSPERAHIVSDILRRFAREDGVFGAEHPRCERSCFDGDLTEMCGACAARVTLVAQTLTAPSTRAWEIWNISEAIPEVVGLAYLTDVVPGFDAKAHYVFFDHNLKDKTVVLKRIIMWVFEDHPEDFWYGLRRLSVEIPVDAKALLHHASRRLGFGGRFWYEERKPGKRIFRLKVEGVREAETPLVLMGLVRPYTQSQTQLAG